MQARLLRDVTVGVSRVSGICSRTDDHCSPMLALEVVEEEAASAIEAQVVLLQRFLERVAVGLGRDVVIPRASLSLAERYVAVWK